MKTAFMTMFLAAALIGFDAAAATTSTVVDIPAPSGGTQRLLYVRPDAPIATIISVPGGDGVLGIQADGSMNTVTGTCGPAGRNRLAIAERGIAVVLVDATSAGVVRSPDDVTEVVRHVQARDNVPVWIVGGSASTGITASLGVSLPANDAVGLVFFSPAREEASFLARIRRPTFVIYHSGDSGQFGNSLYNALTSAVVRERKALTGGTDVGCRFHLFNGLDAEFVAETTGFVQRHNAATRSAALNFQGLWWRAPAGSESGWGVNVTHQGDTLFATWFTYDSDGRGMWLVMSAGTKTAQNTYSGALYRTTGPAFSATPFDPSQVAVTQVGTATFTFSDAGNGTFAYVVNGVSQSKPITRQVYASPVPACAAAETPGTTTNYQALWWSSPAGAESGWGVNIAHQGDILFATWFTYDTDGRGMWLVMSNGARTGTGAYSGTLYRTTGPAFNANPWNGSAVAATEVGTGTFAFSDAGTGTFTFTVGGVTRTKQITRQVYAAPITVCR